jgi:hypothetical protein
MKDKEKSKEDLLYGARFATSETVADNKFLEEVQKEWLELQAAKADRVTPRRER